MLDKKRLSQSQNSARSSTAFRKWKKSIIAAIRRFRLAIASIVPHLSPRISSITDIRDRDNSTSLVESQLTTLRSCRSSRSLYYIIHRVFLDNNIISVLFHGRLSPILLIDFTYLERKKKWYPDSFRFSWWNPTVRNRLLFFRSSSFLVRFSRFLIWPSGARLSFHFNAWSRTRSEQATHPPISNPFLYAPILVE